MPIAPPPGFITRAQAPKHYSRSKRALERDLDDAYVGKDVEVLSRYLLVTKDDRKIPATDFTSLEEKNLAVDNLMEEGMVPTWCVSTNHLLHLEQMQSPSSSQSDSQPEDVPSPSVKAKEKSESSPTVPGSQEDKDSVADVPLPDDLPYLKARIHELERERREEKDAHDATVAKFWDEMAVKNKQIASWDKVTQGLTTRLATGALTPVHRFDSPFLLDPDSHQPSEDVSPATPQTNFTDGKIVEGNSSTKTETSEQPSMAQTETSEEPAEPKQETPKRQTASKQRSTTKSTTRKTPKRRHPRSTNQKSAKTIPRKTKQQKQAPKAQTDTPKKVDEAKMTGKTSNGLLARIRKAVW